MKRFYNLVTIENADNGYAINLDGKPVKTPSGALLYAPTQELAHAIMKEWADQSDEIIPDNMPLTQILTTIQDRIATERSAMEAAALNYLDTDLLCYRTDMPAALAEKQKEAWDTWLNWFERQAGVQLETTTGLAALTQPPEAHSYAQAQIRQMDNYLFGVLQLIVSLTGSLVLALAFVAGDISPEDVLTAIRVEENYKAAIYNEDKHGQAPHEEKKVAALTRDLTAAHYFLQTL